MFTNFFLTGFSSKGLGYYSQGELYEVLSRLGESIKPEDMRIKVRSLLDTWYVSPSVYRDHDKQVPAYALEIHSINEKGNPLNGYGTYVFVPDDQQVKVIVPLTSIFSEPRHIYDDADPLKILAEHFADEDGFSTNDDLTIYELTCQNYDFYPLNTWTKAIANDPLEEIFSVLDSLTFDEYAGISIVLVPPDDGWQTRGKMRIRSIQDPNYQESIGLFARIGRRVRGEPLPEEEVDRLAGYTTQQLDPDEKAEIDAITEKMSCAFRCTIRVYASSPEIAEDLAGIIIQKTNGKYNSMGIYTKVGNLRDLAMRKEGKSPFLMSDQEIASIWHVPAENTGGKKRHHPLPAALTPPEELLMYPLGGPGDIRKLIASVLP